MTADALIDTQIPCRERPDLFFVHSTGPAAQIQADDAITLCRACPVREACLDDVMTWPKGRREVGMVAGGRYFKARTHAEREPDPDLRPCGTYAAYRRHLAHGEKPCEPCRQAANAYARDRYPTDKPRGART